VGTMPAFTLGGTVSGGGNQINNVVIGTSNPLAGAFTTVAATGDITAAGSGARYIIAQTTSTNGQTAAFRVVAPNSDASANSYQVGSGLAADNEWTVQDITANQIVDQYIRGVSGYRKILVNGSEISRHTSTGLAVTGTLSASGAATFSAAAGNAITISHATAPNLRFTKTNATAHSWQFNGATTFSLEDVEGGTTPITVAATTGAVTMPTGGGLAVTGDITANQNSTGTVAQFTNANVTNGYGVSIAAGGTSATRYALIVRDPAANQDWFKVSSETGQVGNSIFAPGPYPSPVVATISTAGLAVTGTLSATGTLSGGTSGR